MAGNQSRGLIAASKTKGWDPTVIPAAPGKPAQDLAAFDVDMGNLPGKRVGEIPGGPPAVIDGNPSHPVLSPRESFSTPDYNREKPQHTNGANPFAGMGGE